MNNTQNCKPFKTYAEQINILKNRGLNIKDSDEKILKKENYYCIINGYKDLFIDYNTSPVKYKMGCSFDEFYAIYCFDRDLRHITLKNILKIEKYVKSLLAYEFCNINQGQYFSISSFDTKNGDKKRLLDIAKMFSTIQQSISLGVEKSEYIKHNFEKYSTLPLWVIINNLTLGNISKFYYLVNQKVQNSVGLTFNIKPEELSNYLKVLSIYRNLCAHDQRLFSEKHKNIIKSTTYHSNFNINKKDGNYLSAVNDFFSLLIIFKRMLEKEDNDEFCDRLKEMIESLSLKLKTICIKDVMEKMGFPSNWYNLKEI